MNLKGKKVAILGFGIEGNDVLKYLVGSGAKITILDKKPAEELDISEVKSHKVDFTCGAKYLNNLSAFDVVFRSPGVYRFLPEIVDAERKGVVISSATKLFFENCPAKIIGVTGTKGKGTTASLIYQILKNANKDVYLAGNIGNPFLELLHRLKKSSFVVMELSSFQLIDLDISPHIAVVLNITSDHLDWHKDNEEYVGAKKNIVRHQKSTDFAVVNFDYELPKGFARNSKGYIYFFSREKRVDPGCFVESGEIIFKEDEDSVSYGSRYNLLLRGDHNLENITAAITACKAIGVEDDVIKATIFNFQGLGHRLELVGSCGGVSFYNDSFATGPQPTIAAIRSFSEPLTVILGGSEKFLDYNELGKEISKSDNIKTVILIGQVAQKIEKALKENAYDGQFISLNNTTMERIVSEAFKNTPKGGVVLLSPAAASFDMFKNYKERGNKFKEAVVALSNE